MLKKIGFILLAATVVLIVSIALGQGPHVPIPADIAPGAERLFPDEAAVAEETAELMIASIAERHKDDPAVLRDAHPFAHGCVRGEFEVRSADAQTLDPKLYRHGVFAEPGRRYPVWIRFSNGSFQRKPDSEGDIRGMAIKLMGVPGDKIGPEKQTQDFLLITNPTMPVGDPAEYLALFKAALAGEPMSYFLSGAPWNWKLGAFRTVIQIRGRAIPSMLNTRYWSAVPYRLGASDAPAVKYSARACADAPNANITMPEYPGERYLRETLVDHLKTRSACFEFMVQHQYDPVLAPVEDPAVEWDEESAPFVPVARIEIPAQEFASPAQDAFCESLSFNPYNSLPAHRPLGGINRVRQAVYERIASYRLNHNGVTRVEPTGNERF